MRFSAVLLAGGKSSRMGRDKVLLEIEGEPLWRRQLATLRGLLPEQIMISGPPRDGCEVVEDEVAGAGPLAGMAAALKNCRSPLLIVLAVDLPAMTTDFLQSLVALCRDGKGVVPRGAEFFEPLAAVYPAACAGLATAALQRAEFSMQNFVRAAMEQELLVPRTILPSEMSLFANLNTPADL
ncbi:MAG: molybdenum cofactor guanylyltransferase [Chthoniobacterales bacterium]|nr:molybdenum cofactor guanylyltransferase [Chthoniobacterales bacterium]